MIEQRVYMTKPYRVLSMRCEHRTPNSNQTLLYAYNLSDAIKLQSTQYTLLHLYMYFQHFVAFGNRMESHILYLAFVMEIYGIAKSVTTELTIYNIAFLQEI